MDTICAARKTVRITGDDYPEEEVKSRFMKLDSSHVQYVMNRPQGVQKIIYKQSANRTVQGCLPSLYSRYPLWPPSVIWEMSSAVKRRSVSPEMEAIARADLTAWERWKPISSCLVGLSRTVKGIRREGKLLQNASTLFLKVSPHIVGEAEYGDRDFLFSFFFMVISFGI